MIANRWLVPAAAGALIVAAFGAGALGGETLRRILMVAAALVAGAPIFRNAVRALMARVIGIDLLVAIAAGGALIIGEYWEAAAVTFLFAIGHALEAATLNRTRSALAALVDVAPDVAVVVRGNEQVEVPAGAVAIGETVLVKNGAKVPVDGVVVAGSGALDEASITGESLPVDKAVGSKVFAGTVSKGGFLQVRAEGVGADTTLARIIHRVEEAQDAKAATQKFMDRFSAWYTPGIMVLALVAGLISGDVTLGLTLLVIGCPGALVISIPVAVVAGIGRAAQSGVLVKGGEFLETAARVNAVALDKTGTLTRGKPRLTDVLVLGEGHTRTSVLRWAALAEAGSEHPLAAPVLAAATQEGAYGGELPTHAESVPGKGVKAVIGNSAVLVGNQSLMEAEGLRDPAAAAAAARLAAAGRTPMLVAVDDAVIGVVAVADELRPEAKELVSQLRRAGVRHVAMLTGDAQPVANAVAASTGITDVRAGLLPEEKLEAIAELRGRGYVVAMVGDGVNDAPALATADIGVAMGAAGSAVAVETADIALMADDLRKLPYAIGLAKRTVRIMRQNIIVALLTVGLLLAGVLWGGVTMAIGMLVHEGSVLLVIANAMRLLIAPATERPSGARRLLRPRSAMDVP